MQFQLTERGLITFAVIVCCTTLLLCGKDTQVGYTLMIVVGGYYGLDITLRKIGREK